MPDEDKKMVPIDTSGPDATIDIEDKKEDTDALLDHRRKGEIELTSKTEDDAALVRAQDALSELDDDMDDEDGDFGEDDGADEAA